MREIHHYHFPNEKYSVYFMGLLRPGVTAPPSGTPQAESFLWNYNETLLKFIHVHGTESDPNFVPFNNGNVEPNRGFGHIAFNTDDVYDACDKLLNAGVKFQKKPDEGRMKGLAFALDPDGYWIEIVKRSADSGITTYYNLSQTMIRVKDPKKSLQFYSEILGMALVGEKHFSDFSLYFLTTLQKDEKKPEMNTYGSLWNQVLELTHNHGTESKPEFSYHSGNTDPKGFGHLGFLVDDVQSAQKVLSELQYQGKQSQEGVLFLTDPDGYHIELDARGLKLQ
uniref:lactoylglutathione lyase n=1 Tax=Arcella intermedia TaxID=1963864 RepID=A0A6B2LD05_9EUKA|eukprot:TRINITY_DN2660_c2_g1_i1.p1 TRINITY_DN2660_c2_g1~~TRINITY_DN2660_c2_g1_i1.p1  ORF type:complete len:328 (+),score=58.59 TRINITY_DN2660_c2_g1_i1:143-985(+)